MATVETGFRVQIELSISERISVFHLGLIIFHRSIGETSPVAKTRKFAAVATRLRFDRLFRESIRLQDDFRQR